MIIKRLAASFGNLRNDELVLKEGLNIIEGPNEAGKSTWCAFIKAMFYGVDTSERDKTGYISDKTRYRPWSGGAMEGSMDISVGGRDITLQRQAQGAAPMKKFTALYTDTAETVPGLTGSVAGETLTGVPLRVFERGAFIKQAGLPVSQTAELEKRISALVSTGEEVSSYTEADDKLRVWLRKRRHNKSGLLPKLESDLMEVNEKLRRMERQSAALGEMSMEIERLEKLRDRLRADSEAHDTIENAKKARRVLEAKTAMETAEMECRRLEKSLPVGDGIPTREDMKSARDEVYALRDLSAKRGQAENDKASAEAEYNALLTKKNASVWADLSYEEARTEANKAASEYKELEETAGRGSLLRNVPFIIAALIYVIALVVTFMDPFASEQAVAARLILTVVYLIFIAATVAMRVFKSRKAEERRQELFLAQEVSSIDELFSRLTEYKSICEELPAAGARFSEKEAALQSVNAELDQREKALRHKLRAVKPDFNDISEALAEISATDELLTAYERVKLGRDTAEEIFNTISASFDKIPETGGEIPEIPEKSREETVFTLRQTEGRLDEITKAYAMAQGEGRAMGDPIVLGAEKNALEDRLERLTAEYEALQTAIDALGDANTEIQTRFSPQLSQRAGELMSRLTGEKYQSLIFDKDLNAEARGTGEAVGRGLLSLSEGTANGAYLALRLAISELVFPMLCPLILDDALVNFDDERVKYALELIHELSRERQVILFTCHNREREYFKNNADVNVILLRFAQRDR